MNDLDSGVIAPSSTSPPSMVPPLRRDRLVALFFAGVVAFNPPLLRVFGAGDSVFGVPLIYFYIFVVWSAVVALLALHIERQRPEDEG